MILLLKKKKYKNLKKYYNKLDLLKLFYLNSNFLVCNNYYYSNVSFIAFQNLISKLKLKNITFNIKNLKYFNTIVLILDFNFFLDKKNINFLKNINYIDIIYIKLITHKKLIFFMYLIDLLNKYGFTNLMIQYKILLLLNYNILKLLKILNKK